MNTSCQRFEREGLENLERGLPLELHFQDCPDCLTAAAAYARVREGLRRLPAKQPPLDWEQRVWAAIHRGAPRRSPWRLVPALSALAAAAVVLLVVLPGQRTEPGLAYQIERTPGSVVRSAAASPGDVLRLKAAPGKNRHAELRLYRDGVLMLRCSDTPPCSVEKGNLVVEHTLSAVGRYEPVLVISDTPLSREGAVESGSLRDRDIDALLAEGIEYVTVPPVNVF